MQSFTYTYVYPNYIYICTCKINYKRNVLYWLCPDELLTFLPQINGNKKHEIWLNKCSSSEHNNKYPTTTEIRKLNNEA